jgi:excisionase family DNA binding protein
MNTLELWDRLDRLEKLILIKSKRILTFEEACAYTGFKPSYLYKLTSLRKIPHSKPLGKVIFFDTETLDPWLAQNQIKPDSEIINSLASK